MIRQVTAEDYLGPNLTRPYWVYFTNAVYQPCRPQFTLQA